MAASQVVLYFDKQEDALLFTLAASSVISSEAPVRAKEALVKIADEIRKASRIRTLQWVDMISTGELIGGFSRKRWEKRASQGDWTTHNCMTT